MKQYRITSEHFVPQGETGEADAYIDLRDLAELKKLAGMPAGLSEGAGGLSDNGAGLVDGIGIQTPQAGENGITSPVGSNISTTAQQRNLLLKKYDARPGDELWFLINFEPVRGLGADAGTLEQKIQSYIKTHPKADPKNAPRPAGTDY